MAVTAFDFPGVGSGRVVIIAEVGTSHAGDAGKARALIEAAARSGADVVKFQHVYADEIIHPLTGDVPLPGGRIPLYERFRALETGPDFLGVCKEAAEAAGLAFLCTPFGLRSARELRGLGVQAMKVASPESNHAPLLAELASYGLPTLVSGGVTTLGDLERAMAVLDGCPLALLHCVTAYPAPCEDYNLALLSPLSALLGVPIGVSDHSMDPVLVPALATARGAAVIEKHICLSRSDPGLDDPIALPPEDFEHMARTVRIATAEGAEATERELAARYGAERISATIGDGRKRLAPSERANYERTRRSIHALRRIRAGEAFTEGNLAVLRTEKVLRPGLDPFLLPAVLGRVAIREVPDGEGLEWADLGGPALA
ncbi:MAG: N-acetylneuraminate synthase family protein [Spirochaetales bacterium]|nr:N-acetylneuraminate synthase family protein [Spirochaetales bacterium]